MNKCGECTMCCTTLPIAEINKPAGTTCFHCDKGCAIYELRPSACNKFECEFIKTDMPKELRPDKAGIFFEKIADDILLGMIDPGTTKWQNDTAQRYMHEQAEKGVSTIISSFSNAPKTFILAEGETPATVFEKAMVEYSKEFNNGST